MSILRHQNHAAEFNKLSYVDNQQSYVSGSKTEVGGSSRNPIAEEEGMLADAKVPWKRSGC